MVAIELHQVLPIDAGLIEPVPAEIIGPLIGAAFAQAGALIAASGEPEGTQRTIAGIMQAWLGTLRSPA